MRRSLQAPQKGIDFFAIISLSVYGCWALVSLYLFTSTFSKTSGGGSFGNLGIALQFLIGSSIALGVSFFMGLISLGLKGIGSGFGILSLALPTITVVMYLFIMKI